MRQVRGLFTSLLVLTLVTLGASPSAAAPEGEMIWGAHISLAPTWFDPAETSGIITPFMVIYALHDAMLKPMPGNPVAPSLAESWTMSPDGLVYDFVLRKGVKFHNGEPVTAEDVKFSLERYRGASNKALKESVAAVETPDPGRVRIRLKRPWPDFMTFYLGATGAAWIVPKRYVEKVGDDGFKKAPVGAGPYKFVSFTPGVEVVLEAFDQYWRKAPNVKRIVLRSIPDETTRLAALKRGEVDIAYNLRGELAQEIRRTSGLTLKPNVGQATHWVYFSEQWDPKSPWHDRRVRLAANLAIDRQSMNQADALGFAKLTGSIIPASFEFYWQPPGYPYDRARTKQLLAEAGYPNGFDAGDYFCDAAIVNIGEPVVNYLNAAGIRVKLRPIERAAYFKGWSEKKHKGAHPRRQRRFRQRRDPDRGLHRGGWHVRLRQLRRYRRPLPGAGERARLEAARGDLAPHPAAHPREGGRRAHLAQRRLVGSGAAGGGVGDRADRRVRMVGPVRRREAEEQMREQP
jgi:peptide/nickel transport system substrate-binding protein